MVEKKDDNLESSGLTEARSDIETVVEMSELEQHFLEVYGSASFEEAMKDEVNFSTFLVEADDIQLEIDPKRFAEMLRVAVTSSEENASLFLESLEAGLINIEDLEMLEGIETAAREMIKEEA